MRKWWVVTFQQIVEFIISFGSITKGAKPLNSGYLLVAPRFNRLQVARNTILYWTKLLIWIETFLFAEINVVAFNENLFVCYAVYRNKRLRIISNIFSCCSTGSDWRLDIDLLCVIFSGHSCSRPLEFWCLVRVFAFGLVSLYTMGVIAITRYFRVAKGFSLTRDGTQIISVMLDLTQISRERRAWA